MALLRAHHMDRFHKMKEEERRDKPDRKAEIAERRQEKSTFELPLSFQPKLQSKKDQSDKTPQEAGSKSAANSLTPGELLYQTLTPTTIHCRKKGCFTEKFLITNQKLLMLTNLPVHYDGYYTEEDLAGMLQRFGFQHDEETLYIVPQNRLAFAMMPSTDKVQKMLAACRRTPLWLKGCQLRLHVVASGISMALFPFYKSLMKAVQYNVTDQGVKTVYVKNISQSETWRLRAAAAKIGPLQNFLPLLDRVYIEFKDARDADQLGVWYSRLDPAPRYQITRMKMPDNGLALQKRSPEPGLPLDSETGATTSCVVPRGSLSPLWITLKTSPFVFPTICPWFNHPEYLTITGQDDIARACLLDPTCPSVIMMTGLPDRNYNQVDVATLVWPYITQQNMYGMYYHVIVLKLQRRAFVYFSEWDKCREFVSAYLANPPYMQGSRPTLHFLLCHTHPQYSEDLLYTTLMEWSDTPVVQPERLELRLLIAEIFSCTVDVVKQVLEVVTSIAPISSFVPLANRICIEMAESRGVAQVLEQYKNYTPTDIKQCFDWYVYL
ncbi:uncharacterized protein LOC143010566 [Genypterus blacodes]|uniref:uncharacterized protein LOC143010566 n=1 Tax=Genypterus blacodes TaxID=154954 RepID=UPI003F75CF61